MIILGFLFEKNLVMIRKDCRCFGLKIKWERITWIFPKKMMIDYFPTWKLNKNIHRYGTRIVQGHNIDQMIGKKETIL